jgi:hypothetical protein
MWAHNQWPSSPWLIAQSVMWIASAGMIGLPAMPLAFENDSDVLLVRVFFGPGETARSHPK